MEPITPLVPLLAQLMAYTGSGACAVIILWALIGVSMRFCGVDVDLPAEQAHSAPSLGVRVHASLVGVALVCFSTFLSLQSSLTYLVAKAPVRAIVTGSFPSIAAVMFFVVTIALVSRGEAALRSGVAAKCWRLGGWFLLASIVTRIGNGAWIVLSQ